MLWANVMWQQSQLFPLLQTLFKSFVHVCWIENWKRALSEFCSQSDNVGQERVLRQQETLTSFKTGDERSVRHWSPDKRFPTERKQHRTFSPPLEKTIANGSNLGPAWRREAKLGIGYKGRGEAGRIRKRAAFHVPPWHQGLSRSRGANKPKNVQNGTRTFCVGAKVLQSGDGRLSRPQRAMIFLIAPQYDIFM